MSFTFGFGGDDIEADEEQQNAVEDEDQAVGSSHMALIPPKSHTLVELVSDRILSGVYVRAYARDD